MAEVRIVVPLEHPGKTGVVETMTAVPRVDRE